MKDNLRETQKNGDIEVKINKKSTIERKNPEASKNLEKRRLETNLKKT